MPSNQDRVLNLVHSQPGLDDDEICRMLQISTRQQVNQICRTLEAAGRIARRPGRFGKIANFPSAGPPPAHGTAAPREPLPAAAPPKPALTGELLIAAGFSPAGCWRLRASGDIQAEADLPKTPGVYAFLIDDVAQYVGVATASLRQRLYFYGRPGGGQLTNLRLNEMIKRELLQGRTISIQVAAPPDLSWNGLPVSGAAGLEIGLIKAFDLPWNVRHSK